MKTRKILSPEDLEHLIIEIKEQHDEIRDDLVKKLNEALIQAKIKEKNIKISYNETNKESPIKWIDISKEGEQTMFLKIEFGTTHEKIEKVIEEFEKNGWEDKILRSEKENVKEYEFIIHE